MRRTALAIMAGLVLAAVGFTAAAFASGDHNASGSDSTTTTTSTTAPTTGTSTTSPTTTTTPTTTTGQTTTTTTTESSHKVLVCHRTGSRKNVTIDVDRHAVRAHLRHGDELGACAQTQTAPTTTATTTTTPTTSAGTTTAVTTTSSEEHHARFQKEVKCAVVFVREGKQHHHDR